MRFVNSSISPSLLAVFLIPMLAACPDPNGNGGENGENGTRTCMRAEDCRPDEDCVGGICQPATSTDCARDSDCPAHQRCDAMTARCVDRNGSNGPDQICVPGQSRCMDSLTLETCNEDGTAWETSTCDDECLHGACVVCVPGTAECVGQVSRVCNAQGSDWNEVDCEPLDVDCVDGLCQVCPPGEQRCADELTFEICNESGSGWDDYACLEGTCNPETSQCEMDGCTPGRFKCEGNDRMVCAADGETWEHLEDCQASGGYCINGRCTDLCAEAAATNSYIGCEYWPVALSNAGLDPVFHQDFAVVLSNPNPGTTASINVYRANGTVAASESVPSGELRVIRLPWNSMNARVSGAPATQKGAIAYRLQSSVPVVAYQFNPLRSRIGSEYSYSNDASMLLPTHVFGLESQYLVIAMPHMDLRAQFMGITQIDSDQPTIVAVVATEDNTSVRLRLRGATASGGGLPNLDPGADRTVTLNKNEVLQLASRQFGTATTVNAACGDMSCRYREYRQSDLSGSIINADKPIAVFSGADCRFVPFTEWACDHMEQQLFPFHNWGSSYVGSVAEPPPGGDASVGDVFRIVAAVDGTTISFTPAIQPTVTLNAGQWREFTTSHHFRVSSQGLTHPIMLAQFFVGQEAHGSSMGDPAMILAVPTEQYRRDFTFITTDTMARNYINIVRPVGATVSLNGTDITGTCSWSNLGNYQVCRHQLPGGTHRVVSSAPIGLTVYGYDEYVSYGYPAGLDLQSLIGVSPGW